jgi:alanyl-tRNA synthetase
MQPKSMTSSEIRELFLSFFESKKHLRMPSSSLIPAEDPTLLFTNAGMVQFKDVFLGVSDVGTKRATTSQKCVRAGGKHNDLENVGFTPRHHTFFEMLGNFSFGDYFKKEAIEFAWEFLTSPKYLNIPKEKLRVTVFQNDDEAFELWKKQGINPDWIYRLGEKDNFWAMGDTGPCGPCTEIHYDWGREACNQKNKDNCQPGCACDTRFLEIWNLVFMQFNRDSSGKMTPLPKPSVDTGGGLERMSCVKQNVFSNYDTDLFTPIIEAISKETGVAYRKSDEGDIAMKVIADHVRASTLLMGDGVFPSNEGRGYVLRRIIRRAVRYGKKLGKESAFIYKVVPVVVKILGKVYPEIKTQEELIQSYLKEEETKFHETLHRGIGILEEQIQKIKSNNQNVLPGEVSFKLYDTFGFPFDLIQVIASENKVTVDEKAFNALMEKQKASSQFEGSKVSKVKENILNNLQNVKSEFTGYENLKETSTLLKLFNEAGMPTKSLKPNEKGFAIFETTPFYPEGGGQVGDHGFIKKGDISFAKVYDTVKVQNAILHSIHAANEMKENTPYELEVDKSLRQLTKNNHTATHLLHAALRKVLGDRVQQAGSLVEPERLRFDFTFPRALTKEERSQIEQSINEQIRNKEEVIAKEMSYDEAIKSGALAFFDEKYGKNVRVIRVGKQTPLSIELCGGTHLDNISDIERFKITSESSVASGVRRIEAITTQERVSLFEDKQTEAELEKKRIEEDKKLKKQKQEEDFKNLLSGNGEDFLDKAEKRNGYNVLSVILKETNPKFLRSLVDKAKDKLKEKTLILIGSDFEGKAALCIGVSKDLVAQFDASKIIGPIAEKVGGTGGGRADFAQAGGQNIAGLEDAKQTFENWLKENL